MNVSNRHGVVFNFEATKLLMDQELYDELINTASDLTEQELFNAYCEMHLNKYGKRWTFDDSNPLS